MRTFKFKKVSHPISDHLIASKLYRKIVCLLQIFNISDYPMRDSYKLNMKTDKVWRDQGLTTLLVIQCRQGKYHEIGRGTQSHPTRTS